MGSFTGAEAAEVGAGTFTWSGGGALLNVTQFTVSREVTLHETTRAGDTERRFNKGLKSSNGTFVAFHDDTNPPVPEGEVGTIVGTAMTGRVYTIKAIIERYDMNWLADGVCEITYTWRQTGTGASTDYTVT